MGHAASAYGLNVPIGHVKRRAEGMPVLVEKFETSVAAHFGAKQTESIKKVFADFAALSSMPVGHFVAKLVSAH